jgi:hypothetical protein
MRKFKIILVLFALTAVFSANVMGHPGRHQPSHNHNGGTSPTVGAPLDGGILAILGIAGVAYFVARKKKNNLGS